MLPAWLFALARHECRRHPPVVWREHHWQDLRRLARGGRVVPGSPLPAGVIRMAVLGLAPRDREVLVLASTRFKLLSRDLAAILEMSLEDAIGSAATARGTRTATTGRTFYRTASPTTGRSDMTPRASAAAGESS